MIIGSSIKPFPRLPVLHYIGVNVGQDSKIPWMHRHISKGFDALDRLLKDHAGKYATGDEIYLTDVFLAPQIDGLSERYNFDMSKYPVLSRLGEAYKQVPAIQDATPENQPDFQIRCDRSCGAFMFGGLYLNAARAI